MNYLERLKGSINETLEGNRFKMNLYFPAVLGLDRLKEFGDIDCVSTDMPSKTIGVKEVPTYGGVPTKLPGNTTVPDWNCVMMLRDRMETYKGIQAWLELIESIRSGTKAPDVAVLGSADVTMYNGQDQPVQVWKMKMMFPLDGGTVSLSKENRDAVLTYDIGWCINDIVPSLDF